jgi:Fe2+ transport system protein FeoA
MTAPLAPPKRRLDTCRAGDNVVVATIDATPARIDRLASLGIMPGIALRVQQTRPVVVVESDETVLALEREIAAGVMVEDGEDPSKEAAE